MTEQSCNVIVSSERRLQDAEEAITTIQAIERRYNIITALIEQSINNDINIKKTYSWKLISGDDLSPRISPVTAMAVFVAISVYKAPATSLTDPARAERHPENDDKADTE